MAQLRAVGPNDRAPRRPLTISEAVATGDRRQILIAMRTRVSVTLEDRGLHARDVASLSGRLLELTAALDALDAPVVAATSAEKPATPASAVDESFDPGEV